MTDDGPLMVGFADVELLLRGDPAETERHQIYRRLMAALVGLTAVYEGRACLATYGSRYLGLVDQKRSPRYRVRV